MVTELSVGDAQWAAGLMERQRRIYAHYSPPGTWGVDGATLLLAAAERLATVSGVGTVRRQAGPRSPRIRSSSSARRRLGGVLAVVPAEPGAARASELARKGWTVASDWYVGWPVRAR